MLFRSGVIFRQAGCEIDRGQTAQQFHVAENKKGMKDYKLELMSSYKLETEKTLAFWKGAALFSVIFTAFTAVMATSVVLSCL